MNRRERKRERERERGRGTSKKRGDAGVEGDGRKR